MAEYRRFISYFYEYREGKRQKNTGFARMEQRGEQWKLLIHINGDGLAGGAMKIYGLVREDDGITGILLGRVYPSPRGLEKLLSGSGGGIGKRGCSVQDLAGIWVSGENGKDFLTIWDDGEAAPEQIRDENEKRPREAEEQTAAEETEVQNRIPEQDSTLHMQEADPVFPRTSERITAENSREQDWKMISQHCREMEPPQELAAAECRQVYLNHLDYLRQRGWRIGRNSFLLHGWYQYRGLMLARMEDGGFVLGVPGSCDSQERYMARMYGFSQFYSAAAKESGHAPCGYWCRRL